MSVNEVLQALGQWDLTLSQDKLPRDVLDALEYFGHVAIVEGRLDPRSTGDGLLTAARYVGVLRGRVTDDETVKLSGCGMGLWLGDEDDKGAVIEDAINLTAATFANAIRAVLPASVREGVLHSVPGTITQRIQWQTPRKAIEYICSSFGNGTLGASAVEYRVNNDGTLDAGYVSDLYVTTPACIITPRNAAGYDLAMVGLPGAFGVARDVEDWTSRVVLMGEGSGISLVTGSADITSNPYLDLFGNPVRMTRLISESDTPASSASTRAALNLAQFTGTKDQLSLSLDDYDVTGSFRCGDMVHVWDPDAGLTNTANEVMFRGQRINPIALRVTEVTWPVVDGMTVAYRAKDGTWWDLTDYVTPESGTASVVVGGFTRQLTASNSEPVGTRPAVDTSIPAAPTLIAPFETAVYLDARGFTRAKMLIHWSAPLNTDGSVILDGDHYEIRYAVDTDVIYPASWASVAQIRWEDMQTWGQPFAYPSGAWQTIIAPWGDTSMLLQDLSPGIGYDVQIRAVDTSGHASDWSGTVTSIAQPDNIPPSTPAAPQVAASRIAIQITHDLGKSTGGSFNLESDLDHLDIHVSSEPTFMPDDTTRVGRLKATGGMVAAQIPAVGTFQVEETSQRWVKVVAVDIAGNASNASDAASATALLIDDAHISDLTVSKVTAGTINADWIVAASIKTAPSGARVELSSAGLLAYDGAGTQTVNIASADGSVTIVGQLSSGTSGSRVIVNPAGATLPEIRWYPSTGANYSKIQASGTDFAGEATMHLTSGVNAGNTASSDLMVAAGLIRARIKDQNGVYQGANTLDIAGDYTLLGTGNRFISGASGGFHYALSGTGGYGEVGYSDGPNDNYFHFGHDSITFHIGTWDDFIDRGATTGLFTGHLVFTASPSSCSVSYGATRASTPRVIESPFDSPPFGHTVTAQSTSGFTVGFTAAANGSVDINFWCFRT